MGNDFGLENPFYTSHDGKFKIYKDNSPDEHQMLVDNNKHASLPRGALRGVAREEEGLVDYVMKQIVASDVDQHNINYIMFRHEVTQALLRGRTAELEKQLDAAVEENLRLQGVGQ